MCCMEDSVRNGLSVEPARLSEAKEIRALAALVLREVYGALLKDRMPSLEKPWQEALVVRDERRIVGFVLTQDDRLEDLWLLPETRGAGLGQKLLSAAEAQIAARGYRQARLRVVADNLGARRFYAREGWKELRHFEHENLVISMYEMVKPL